MATLILKRASASRPSGQWSEDDYDVIADDAVVARIMLAAAAQVGSPWLWTLATATMRIARRRTATKRLAREQWQRSRGVGAGSSRGRGRARADHADAGRKALAAAER